MNENYLNYLTSFDGHNRTYRYIRNSSYGIPNFDYDDFFIPVKTKDHSFLKQELKPMSFLPEERRVFTINFGSMCDEEIEDFKRRLIESLTRF